MKHRLAELVISLWPEWYWRLKWEKFLTDPWQKRIFPQHHWLAKMIKKFKPRSVLEAGCGFGRNLNWLIKQGIKPEIFTGVDISQQLLAQSRLPKTVRLIRSNVLHLPFASNCFDLVFTHGLLMHLNPRQLNQAVAELIRATKKYLIIIEEVRLRPQRLNYFTWAHDYDKIIAALPLKVVIKKPGKY
ncbi:MAG: class I SAM-dependent methyltransferase, partial [Patescibacteria group bacterium]|nr:class I SAM-dependent methyltransferase [Patescibacteria group bacterium]